MSPRNLNGHELSKARIHWHWTRQTGREIEVCISETGVGETNFVGRYPADIAVVSGCLPDELILRKRVLNLRAEIIKRTGCGYIGVVESLQSSARIDRSSG